MGSTALLRYRLLSRLAEVMPVRGVKPFCNACSAVVMRLSTGRSQQVERNFERVTGRKPTHDEVKATFASYGRYWLDALRLPVVPTDRLEDIFKVEGLENIEKARAEGRGIILALPHVGNWDVAGAWLVHNGLPLTVVVENLEPPEMFTWFRNFRESLGLSVVTNDRGVTSALLAALKRNEAIALLADRDVGGSGGEYEFFGEKTTLPKGPALLALRSGAALLPVAVFEDGTGYKAVIEPALPVERSGRLTEDVDRITAELTRHMEGLIRQAPEQWHLFLPNWPSDRSHTNHN